MRQSKLRTRLLIWHKNPSEIIRFLLALILYQALVAFPVFPVFPFFPVLLVLPVLPVLLVLLVLQSPPQTPQNPRFLQKIATITIISPKNRYIAKHFRAYVRVGGVQNTR